MSIGDLYDFLDKNDFEDKYELWTLLNT
jgi:hypothetical protein